MRRIIVVLCAVALLFSCDEGDDAVNPTSPNTSNNTSTNDTTNKDTTTMAFDNSYQFSDDGVECFPHTTNPLIGTNGILSLISKPCSNSGSKLDGYFKWNYRPAPGIYKVIGEKGTVPYSPNMNQEEFAMVFYGHGQSTLYSVAGTIEVSKNILDTSTLDLNWKDIEMIFEHDSSMITFSGNLKGL